MTNPETPLSRYREALAAGAIKEDAAQEAAVFRLEDLFNRLIDPEPGPAKRLFQKIVPVLAGKRSPVRGLYFWGGVGRGKTYLMDAFFDCLPFRDKQRLHFHVFMRRVHVELKDTRDRADPIAIIARKLANEFRVLCFDEFVVNDVADAVILAGLLRGLINRGVTLVATSNIEPDELYRGGLQRGLFLPAIDLIKRHTEVFHMDGETDYRLQFLDSAETWFTPLGERARAGLGYNFEHISPETGIPGREIEINGRQIPTVLLADGVAWFEFAELCGGPRSQDDYIELARCFHTLLLSDIPVLDKSRDDEARRLINLVDVLYDHNVNLLASAEEVPSGLYLGNRLAPEFRRTASRLTEMRSHDYLARPHLC